MFSLESEVLQRHLDFFKDKSVLLMGGINDDFPISLRHLAQSVQVSSCYFDYANRQSAVNFSLDLPVSDSEVVIYYWTKNKQEVAFQLMQLLALATPSQLILIVGENRCGVRSVEKMLSPYGQVHKIDSARRCGLYVFSLENPPHFNLSDYWKTYKNIKLGDLTLYSLPGVFSASELDAGTELLISTLDHQIKGKVLDLGCGVGVIGSYIKANNPQVEVTMSDIHAMALASTKRTLKENQLNAEVIASDVFSHIEGKFDLIISNPPFHDGIDTAYRAVRELIQQAKWHLSPNGELRIVANTFLPYADLLDEYFGQHKVLAKTTKFKVYSVKV